MLKTGFLLLVCLALAFDAAAQGPDAAWRTLETPHFRLHYPAPAEAWTVRAAARIEAIRERVIADVGYAPPQVIDVVVSDPVAQSNGMALPLLGWPRLVLWTTPPSPGSGLGEYGDWTELLVVHEETHLAHLLRPSRNPLQRLIEALLPLGPISLRAPRWVHEGYATLVEGRLTGAGRPNGDLRAAILRQRARAGKLPTYRQMASDSRSWLGMSMAYLAGSAYLEWLEGRAGPDSFKHLWARLTARADRGFEQAFEGVFGELPEKLYGRFTAELTWRAMEAERRLDPIKREGELWQDLTWSTGEPTVSRDGKLLAIVLRDREKPSRLVVWSTGPDEKAEKEWRERTEKMRKRDPQDVVAVRSKPLPRKPLHEMVTRDGAEPFTPRFMPDGRSVLFVRFEPDAEGFLHPDMFRWALGGGQVSRLTRLADVREADPSPDGTWAAAVRHRNGFSQLVRVDLTTGAASDLTPPSLDEVYSSPRVSPDGRRIVFVRHQEGAWALIVRDLSTDRETKLPTPARGIAAYPAWSADGTRVLASVGHDGFVDVMSFDSDGGAAQPVTASAGAALAPAPDGSGVFFLSLQADGLALRYLPTDAAPTEVALVRLPADLAPAVRPAPPPAPRPLAAAEVAPGRPYGLGRQELFPVVGGTAAPSSRGWELGLRAGDIVGKLDALAIGAIADEAGPRGGTLAATWRGWPVAVSLQAFDAKERPSRQPREVAGLGESLDVERRGVELSGAWRRQWRAAILDLGGGAFASSLEPESGEGVNQRVGFMAAQLAMTPSLGQWRFPHLFAAQVAAGRTGEESWRRFGGAITVGVEKRGSGLSLSWQRESVRDATSDFDRLQLGGVTPSILPAEAAGGRIPVPSLPAGTRIGDEYEGQRVTAKVGGVPLFFARHRVWDRGGPKGDWLRLAGIEWDLASDPLPIVRLPGLHVTLGVARVLDEPLKDTTQAWLGLAWRP